MRHSTSMKFCLFLLLVCLLFSATPPSVVAEEPYSNANSLFMMTPPNGWKITDKPPDGFMFVLYKDAAQRDWWAMIAAFGRVVKPDTSSLKDLVATFTKEAPKNFNNFTLLQERDVKVAGIDAIEQVSTWTSPGWIFRQRQIFLLRREKGPDGRYFREIRYVIGYTSAISSYDTYFADADRSINSLKYVEKVTFDSQPRIASITIGQKIYSAQELPKTLLFIPGTEVSFSVNSPVPDSGFMGILGGKILFDRWSQDVSGTSLAAKIKVDGPKNVTAVWKTDSTQAYITLGALSVISILALAGSVVFMKKRRPLDSTASGSTASPTTPTN